MSRYDNEKCPVCNKQFAENDDVVVCPECGAPHHRECYNKAGRCFYEAEHKDGKRWEDRRDEQRREQEDTDKKKCPKCGAQNPVDGIFCQVCGYPLRNSAPEEDVPPFTGGFYGADPINFTPFTTPYGGVSPDEDIEGVTAKELALFVGENSFYYVPKMKEIKKEKKKVSWNWSACIFSFMYYFNRKMYLTGTLLLALYIITLVPSFVFTYYIMMNNADQLVNGTLLYGMLDYSGLEILSYISNIARVVWLGITVVSGLFANKLYTEFVYRRIKSVREQSGGADRNSPEYVNELAAAGRTNRAAALGSICIIVALYIIVSIAIFTLAASPYMY